MEVHKIHPINNNHLVQVEEQNANRLIHLAGKRQLSGTRSGKCLRSDRFEGANVLVCQGGAPIGDRGHLFLVQRRAFIRVDGDIQEPYVHIEPIELVRSTLIITPEIYNWSGWYTVLDTFPNNEISPGDEVFPLYGTPRIEMGDDTEYIHLEGIGVVKC